MTKALELLSEARRVLQTGLAPSLSGEARLTARLAANAVATAEREIALAGRLAVAEAALPHAVDGIRAGRHDGDEDLYRRLFALAVLRAHIADPSAPTAEERRLWIGERAP